MLCAYKFFENSLSLLSGRMVSHQKYFVFMKLFRASSFTRSNELYVKTEDMHLTNKQCLFLHPIPNRLQNKLYYLLYLCLLGTVIYGKQYQCFTLTSVCRRRTQKLVLPQGINMTFLKRESQTVAENTRRGDVPVGQQVFENLL